MRAPIGWSPPGGVPAGTVRQDAKARLVLERKPTRWTVVSDEWNHDRQRYERRTLYFDRADDLYIEVWQDRNRRMWVVCALTDIWPPRRYDERRNRWLCRYATAARVGTAEGAPTGDPQKNWPD